MGCPFSFSTLSEKATSAAVTLRAIGEARLGTQPETVVELVGRDAHRLREQPIDRIRLVAVGGHQRVEGRRHPRRAVALPRIDIERVEGVEVLVAACSRNLQRQQAAGRRLRVHVGEMREVRRQGDIAERRQAVGLDGVVGKRGERSGDERRERPSCAGLQRRSARQYYRHRIVRLHVSCSARFTALARSLLATAAKTRRRRRPRLQSE